MDRNLLEVQGFLGADALVKEKSSSSVTYAILKVAVNRSKYEESTNKWVELDPYWYEVVAFDRLADQCASLKKGDGVIVKADVVPYTYEIEVFNHAGEKEVKTIYSTKFIAKKVVKFNYLQKVTEDNQTTTGQTVDQVTDLNH